MNVTTRLGSLVLTASLGLLLLTSNNAPGTNAGPIPPPPNDNFADAIEVSLLPFSEDVDMAGATVENSENIPACNSFFGNLFHTVWYRYTPPDNTVVVASAKTEGRSMGVAVWAEREPSLRHITCTGFGFNGGEVARVAFDAEAGTTYYFQIDVTSTEDIPLTTFSLKAPGTPPHDDFANAMSIPTLPFADVVNIGAATDEPDEPASCYREASMTRTLWYAFTPQEDMVVVADVSHTDATVIMNAFRATGAELKRIACRGRFDDDARIGIEVEAGQLYYFQLGGFIGTLSWELTEGLPPANDNVSSAIDLVDLPLQADIDTIAAGVEPGEPTPSCSDSLATSIWYRITTTERSLIVVDAAGDDTRPQVGVYQGDSLDAMTEVMCGDDSPQALYSRTTIGFEALPGETYYLQIAGYQQGPRPPIVTEVSEPNTYGDGGNLAVEISSREIPDCPPPEDTVPDPKEDVRLSFDRVGGHLYHDIVSTGISATDDDICLHVEFNESVETADAGKDIGFRGSARFDIDADPATGTFGANCGRVSPRGIDISIRPSSGFGYLAEVRAGMEPSGYAVTTFEGSVMTLAIPKELLGLGEAFRYSVKAVTQRGGIFTRGEDCAPDHDAIHIPALLYGDATCDGLVNPLDATVILQHFAGFRGAAACYYAGDVNRDGTTTPIDATLILQFSARLLDALPIAS